MIHISGYPIFKGQVLSGDDVWTIFQGLLANDLAHYSHLLTCKRKKEMKVNKIKNKKGIGKKERKKEKAAKRNYERG